MPKKIKPCPHCGEKKHLLKAHICSRKLPFWYYIECDKCHWCGETKLFLNRAISAWNKDRSDYTIEYEKVLLDEGTVPFAVAAVYEPIGKKEEKKWGWVYYDALGSVVSVSYERPMGSVVSFFMEYMGFANQGVADYLNEEF